MRKTIALQYEKSIQRHPAKPRKPFNCGLGRAVSYNVRHVYETAHREDTTVLRATSPLSGITAWRAGFPFAIWAVVAQLLSSYAGRLDRGLPDRDEPDSLELEPARTAAAGRHALPQCRLGPAADPPVADEGAGTARGTGTGSRPGAPRRTLLPADGDRGAPGPPGNHRPHLGRCDPSSPL